MAKQRILIAEDEAIIALDLQSILRKRGYHVLGVVFSGEAAIQKIDEEPPDLVLMDIYLAGEMNGIETAQQIQARFNIPVIYVTAYSDDALLQQAKMASSYGYLVKPIQDRELYATIEMAFHRYELEIRLRESERRLDSTLRSIGDAVIMTDIHGCIKLMNYAAEELTGWNQEEALEHDLTEVFPISSETADEVTENPVAGVIRNGVMADLGNHTPLFRKDGTRVPIDGSITPVHDDKRNITGVVLVFRDIIERKNAEEELRKSEEKYRILVENASEAIIVAQDGILRFANPKATELTGYSRDEIISRPFTDFIHPDDREMIFERYLGRLEGKKYPHTHPFRIVDKTGNTKWVEIRVDLLTWEGKPATLNLLTDVTERKQDEESIRQMAEDLSLINSLNNALNRGDSLQEIIRLFTRETKRIFSCHDATVYFPSEDGKYLIAHRPEFPQLLVKEIERLIGRKIQSLKIPLKEGSAYLEILQSRKPRLINDPKAIQRMMADFADNKTWKKLLPRIQRRLALNSVMAIPLISEGKCICFIDISRSEPFTEPDLRRLETVSKELGHSIAHRIADNALQASNEFLNTIMESLTYPFYVIDANDYTIKLMNSAAGLANLSEDTTCYAAINERSTPCGGIEHPCTLEKIKKTRKPVTAEHIHYDKDGNPRNIEVHGYPIFDGEGNVARIIEYILDITERKRAEEALRASERDLRKEREREQKYLNVAGVMILVLDADGTVSLINQKGCEILGCNEGEIIGKDWFSHFLPERMIDEVRDTFDKLMTGAVKQVEYYENPILTKSGQERIIAWHDTILTDEAGSVIGTLSSGSDITDRKHAEESLKESEERFRAIFDNADDGILMVDLETQKFYTGNKAFCQMLGYDSVEEIKNLGIMDIHPQEDLSYAMEQFEKQSRGEITLAKDIPVKRRDGSVFYADVNSSPVSLSGRMYLMGIFRDITVRKEMEELLKEERAMLAQRVEERTAELALANAELVRADRLKDEFFAGMSHELRTPLSAILGMSEALQEGVYGPLNENQIAPVCSVEESGRHLLDLINDILDLSKIEAGKLELMMSQVSIESICESSLRFVKQEAHMKQLKVSSSFDTAVTTLQADERRLKQILVNLLNNAVKFTNEDGEIGLDVAGDAEQQMVHFAVWDTGIGIPREHMEKLFEAFVQLDSSLSRQYTGTGLGLALVRRLVELHGGSVSVESEVGKGSRFTVSLPWQGVPQTIEDPIPEHGPEQTLDMTSPTQMQDPASLVMSNGNAEAEHPLILLTDDNEFVTDTISDFLLFMGFRVIVARSGKDAIEQARQKRPDLILMDIQMPDMDGLETMRRIRADVDLATIPVIALTALAMPGDHERCLEAGANDYVTKPVVIKELAIKIKAQLNQDQVEVDST